MKTITYLPWQMVVDGGRSFPASAWQMAARYIGLPLYHGRSFHELSTAMSDRLSKADFGLVHGVFAEIGGSA